MPGGIFVGRRREIAELKTALADALVGRGSLVLLSGEPGIGKTRLITEMASLAEQDGAVRRQAPGTGISSDWTTSWLRDPCEGVPRPSQA